MARGKHSGIFQKRKAGTNQPDLESKVADFAYQNDSLAQLIVEAWSDQSFNTKLTQGSNNSRSSEAKRVLADRGIYMAQPIVITEQEYDDGFVWDPDDGVVLVLPNKSRTSTTPANQSLVETAKLLMACVPNGI